MPLYLRTSHTIYNNDTLSEHALQCNCMQSQPWPLSQVVVCGQKKAAKARVLTVLHVLPWVRNGLYLSVNVGC
jgi:hypothetical protein